MKRYLSRGRKNGEYRRKNKRFSILYSLFCILYIILYISTASPAIAQPRYKGEVEVATDLSFISSNKVLSDAFGVSLRGHLEANYALDPVDFRAVLDPTLRISGSDVEDAFLEPGLTEAFALYRVGDVDLSAGLERLPLETARLSVPFRLEPVNKVGQPLGLLGVRASIFLDDWRIRPAALYRYQDEQLGGVVSVRREFSSFDLEAHVLYLDRFAAGLGGSGLIGDIVVYAEGWLLSDPWDGRGAVGLSGFWGDLLWTGEVAYAADPLDLNLDVEEEGEAYPRLLAQLSLPQGDAGSWELNASVGLKDSALTDSSTFQALGSLLYTHSESDYGLTAGPTFNHSEFATVYGLRFGVTSFF